MKSHAYINDSQRMRIKRRPGQLEPLWEACELAHEDADEAYRRWRNAAPRDRAEAYCAYVAAADREAAAERFLSASTASAGGVR